MDTLDTQVAEALRRVLSNTSKTAEPKKPSVPVERGSPADIKVLERYVQKYHFQVQSSPYTNSDFLAECLYRAVKSKVRLSSPDKIKAWFDTIARNLIIDIIRRRMTQRKHEQQLQDRSQEYVMGIQIPELDFWLARGAIEPDASIDIQDFEQYLVRHAADLISFMRLRLEAFEQVRGQDRERELVMSKSGLSAKQYQDRCCQLKQQVENYCATLSRVRNVNRCQHPLSERSSTDDNRRKS
jgi:hypothetical protein